jgi:hypothetical protein
MPSAFWIVIGVMFALSAAVLFVCAVAGFRQRILARVLEAIAGFVSVLNAVAALAPDNSGKHLTLLVLAWLATPFVAVSNIVRVRQAERLRHQQLAATYEAERADRRANL